MKKDYVILAIVVIPVFLFSYHGIQRARQNGLRMMCGHNIHNLNLSIRHNMYCEDSEKTPFFGNCDGSEEFWSWRLAYIREYAKELFQQFNLNEPWNSEYNLPLVEKLPINDQNIPAQYRLEFSRRLPSHFFCRADYGHSVHSYPDPTVMLSPYVAVTGLGTVWTAMREGILTKDTPNRAEFRDMILFIETSEPKNHWAEPGDDVSPDEVIRLFEADPGLVKNSGRPFPKRYSHWPKHFVRFDGSVGSFSEFEDVEALRRALVHPRLMGIDESPQQE